MERKLDYIEDCNVNCIHLMPFLDTVEGKSDGGYAVADFRKVREDLGTIDDLAHFHSGMSRREASMCAWILL